MPDSLGEVAWCTTGTKIYFVYHLTKHTLWNFTFQYLINFLQSNFQQNQINLKTFLQQHFNQTERIDIKNRTQPFRILKLF